MDVHNDSKSQGNGSQQPGQGIDTIVLEIIQHRIPERVDSWKPTLWKPDLQGSPTLGVTLCKVGILESPNFGDSFFHPF
jgi:hypothetical protein